MLVAKVNQDGVELAYLDSGVPVGGGNYTTLVIIHGYCYNAYVFQKAVDAAPSHGLRIIALNRRDYAGSSPFTPEEMAPIQAEGCTGDTLRSFLRDRAEEYAGFLKYIVDAGGVTKPSGNRLEGGIVLMAWSLGNVFGLNFLENVASLSAPLKEVVTSYVRSYILFDPAFEAVALSPPSPEHSEWSNKILAKFHDPADPNNVDNIMKGVTAINDWLTGWFHYNVSSTDPVKRYVEPNEHPFKQSTRQEQLNTEFHKCSNFSAFTNENTILKGIYLDVFDSTARSLVLSKDGTAKLGLGVDIKYMYCENSCWTCVYAGESIRKVFEDSGRGQKIMVINHANHFVQWVNPESFIQGTLTLL